MQFKIGEGLYLGGSSKYQLSSPIQGLASPDFRVGDGLYAGRDGGFVSGHFYGKRQIILTGFFIGDDCADTDKLRRNLVQYLRIRYLLPIFVTTFGGETYYTEGYITNVKCEITGPRAGQYQLTFLCPDPIIYYAGTGMSEEETWATDNLTYGSTASIFNGGGVANYPIIELTGRIVNPVVTNETTTKTMKISKTMTAGQVLTINMAKRIITVDGSSISIDRSTDSSWWGLLTGGNEISLSGDSASLTKAVIKHRKGFAGI